MWRLWPGQWVRAPPPTGGWVRRLPAVQGPEERQRADAVIHNASNLPAGPQNLGPDRTTVLGSEGSSPWPRPLGPALALPELPPPHSPLAQEGTFLCGPVTGLVPPQTSSYSSQPRLRLLATRVTSPFVLFA